MRAKHTKLRGYVDAIHDDGWWATLSTGKEEFYAEMKPEFLDPDAVEGSLFTIHRTKRGRTYIYWIKRPLITQRQIKKARRWAEKIRKELGWHEEIG